MARKAVAHRTQQVSPCRLLNLKMHRRTGAGLSRIMAWFQALLGPHAELAGHDIAAILVGPVAEHVNIKTAA